MFAPGWRRRRWVFWRGRRFYFSPISETEREQRRKGRTLERRIGADGASPPPPVTSCLRRTRVLADISRCWTIVASSLVHFGKKDEHLISCCAACLVVNFLIVNFSFSTSLVIGIPSVTDLSFSFLSAIDITRQVQSHLSSLFERHGSFAPSHRREFTRESSWFLYF